MTNTFKVVMLPTPKNSQIFLEPDNSLTYYRHSQKRGRVGSAQNLYILSDEEIKKGDHVYCSLIKQVFMCQATITVTMKKIIASTDKLFVEPYQGHYAGKDITNYIPQIPKSFIQAYIKAHNEGKPITEVDLEMEDIGRKEWYGSDKDGQPIWIEDWKIKAHSNNTVIIHQEKTYNRNDIINLIEKFNQDACNQVGMGEQAILRQISVEKWIEVNLK